MPAPSPMQFASGKRIPRRTNPLRHSRRLGKVRLSSAWLVSFVRGRGRRSFHERGEARRRVLCARRCSCPFHGRREVRRSRRRKHRASGRSDAGSGREERAPRAIDAASRTLASRSRPSRRRRGQRDVAMRRRPAPSFFAKSSLLFGRVRPNYSLGKESWVLSRSRDTPRHESRQKRKRRREQKRRGSSEDSGEKSQKRSSGREEKGRAKTEATSSDGGRRREPMKEQQRRLWTSVTNLLRGKGFSEGDLLREEASLQKETGRDTCGPRL